jgi:hypothetical protein
MSAMDLPEPEELPAVTVPLNRVVAKAIYSPTASFQCRDQLKLDHIRTIDTTRNRANLAQPEFYIPARLL